MLVVFTTIDNNNTFHYIILLGPVTLRYFVWCSKSDRHRHACVSENEGGHVLHSDYRAVAERQFAVRRGRPRYEVTKEQLELFVERRFSVSEWQVYYTSVLAW